MPVNLFQVYMEELVDDDYLFICSSLYPSICTSLLSKLILFNKRMHEETMMHRKFALDGSPWEFNLRDVLRSCQIIKGLGHLLSLPFIPLIFSGFWFLRCCVQSQIHPHCPKIIAFWMLSMFKGCVQNQTEEKSYSCMSRYLK